MPVFTIKEIEDHRKSSGKNGQSIIKTRDRGRKFKEERYLSADDIYAKLLGKVFCVKSTCRASMKKEERKMYVELDIKSGKVVKAKCGCRWNVWLLQSCNGTTF